MLAALACGLMGYLLAWELVQGIASPPAEIFDKPSFVLEAASVYWKSLRILTFLVLIGIVYTPGRTSGSRFSQILSQPARILLASVVSIPAYTYGFAEYNWYTDQAYLADRLLIVASALLSLRYALFLPVLFLLCLTADGQWSYVLPHDGESTNRHLFHHLLLFTSCLVPALRLSRGTMEETFFIETTSFVGAHYFAAAIGKMALGDSPYDWLLYNELGNLALSFHLNGWPLLGHFNVEGAAHLLNRISLLIAGATLAIELAGIVPVSFRKVFAALALARAGVHLGIFLLIGDLFWSWIALDFVLAACVLGLRRSNQRLSPRSHAVWLPTLFALAVFLLAPTIPFAWFDSPLGHRFVVYVKDASGRHHELPDHFAAPFDLALTHGHFEYLGGDERYAVSGCSTTVDWNLYRDVQELNSVTSAREFLSGLPIQEGQTWKQEKFSVFCERLLVHLGNQSSPSRLSSFLDTVAPPAHIWTYPRASRVWDPSIEPDGLVVVMHRHLFSEKALFEFDEKTIFQYPTTNDVDTH